MSALQGGEETLPPGPPQPSDNDAAGTDPQVTVPDNNDPNGGSPEGGQKGESQSPVPQTPSGSHPHPVYHHLTPQPSAGYYLYQQPQQQVTPEPSSPSGGPSRVYDIASFLQQQQALGHPQVVVGNPFQPAAGHQYAASALSGPPLSPAPSGSSNGAGPKGLSMGVIPPPSPLFPRAAPSNGQVPGLEHGGENQQGVDNSGGQRGAPPPPGQPPPYGDAPPSPGVPPYMNSPALGGYGVYPPYGNPTGASAATSTPDQAAWADRSQQGLLFYQPQPPASPRVQPAPYGSATREQRSYSFDELLPPSALDPQQEHSQGGYPSPYGGAPAGSAGAASGGGGGTLFAHQPWGYGSGSGPMFSVPQSPVQQRHVHAQPQGSHMGGGPHQPYGGRQAYAYGYPQDPAGVPFYPATSPGPPIQTTASNKGPDGANLFIFHIPNHFTNQDMYHLFCQYGNLLSVRIMVEKDTGRSRGFGFVSYDSPESAAMAIKELNGFAIGNKRLKVQHKQIRANNDHQQPQQHNYLANYAPTSGGEVTYAGGPAEGTDPVGALASSPTSSQWYSNPQQGQVPGNTGGAHDGGVVEGGIPPQTKPEGYEPPEDSASGGGANSTGASPLSSLDPLRQALPDVSD